MYTEILDEFVKLAEENPEEAEKIASELLKEAGISTALKTAVKKGTKKITAVGSGIKDVVSAVGSDIRNTGLKKNIEGALDGDVLKANVGKTMHNVGNVIEKHPVGSMAAGVAGGIATGKAIKKRKNEKEASYISTYNEFIKLAEEDPIEAEKLASELLKEANERNPKSFLGIKNRDSFEEYPTMQEHWQKYKSDMKNSMKYTVPVGAALGAIPGHGQTAPILFGAGVGASASNLYANIKGVMDDSKAAEKRYAGDSKSMRDAKVYGPQIADWKKSRRDNKQARKEAK